MYYWSKAIKCLMYKNKYKSIYAKSSYAILCHLTHFWPVFPFYTP